MEFSCYQCREWDGATGGCYRTDCIHNSKYGNKGLDLYPHGDYDRAFEEKSEQTRRCIGCSHYDWRSNTCSAFECIRNESEYERRTKKVSGMDATKELTDQASLAHIAINDTNSSVHKKAIEKLTDQSILADVVIHEKNGICRMDALEKLTDQTLLIDVARNSKYSCTRMIAAEKTNDLAFMQEIYTDIAKHDEVFYHRVEAAEKLNDQVLAQEIYAYVAKNGGGQARTAAVEKLNDQNVLADVAKNDGLGIVRITAAAKLTDQAHAQRVIADVAENDSNSTVREKAAAMRTDISSAADSDIGYKCYHCNRWDESAGDCYSLCIHNSFKYKNCFADLYEYRGY